MPRGVPRLGALVEPAPTGEVVGAIDLENLSRPETPPVEWKSPTDEIVRVIDSPPPWEVDPNGWRSDSTDARRFIDCPDDWVLRWVNQTYVEHGAGFRWWTPIPATHELVNLKVPGMRSPENYIRKGGPRGDILCMMPIHWYESRQREKSREVARRTQAAIDNDRQLAEDMRRGKFDGGRGYVAIDKIVHPSNTTGEGKSMDRS